MRFLPLILLIASCAGTKPALCVSRCGLRVIQPAPAGFCDHLQSTEDKVLRAFSRVRTDDRFAKACAAFNGWEISVHPGPSWVTLQGSVSGMTYCPAGYTETNSMMPDTASSSLGHELAHVVQGCVPLPPYAGEPYTQEYYHSNWMPIYFNLIAEGLGP